MFGRVILWFKRRSLRKVSASAAESLHEVATVLYVIRKHKPEIADRINIFLDEVVYPTIDEINRIGDDLCPTSKKNGEQKSTLTLVR